MSAIINIILDILVSIAVFYLLFDNILWRKKHKNLMAKYLQEVLDKQTVLVRLSEIIDVQQTKELEESDGFVKFLSQSRDWAYQYIEDTQSVIADFTSVVDVEIKSIKNKKIIEAYDKLKQVLPKEE
jgi:hypothetical protein